MLHNATQCYTMLHNATQFIYPFVRPPSVKKLSTKQAINHSFQTPCSVDLKYLKFAILVVFIVVPVSNHHPRYAGGLKCGDLNLKDLLILSSPSNVLPLSC